MAAIASVTSYEYAAGTCTLRLVGQLSPLGQVTGRPVLGRSRFYLQVHQEDVADVAGAGLLVEASGREPQFSALNDLVQTYVQSHLSAHTLGSGSTMFRGEVSLQPVGLTRHRLTLPAPPAPPRVVDLSTLQLADLADALEQADAALQIIPDDAIAKARSARPRLSLWLGSVAAVGIAALLGNQLLTTAPSSVVLSPNSPSANGSPAQSPAQTPSDNQPSTQAESAPDSALESAGPTAVGEATPTAPGPPSARSAEGGAPKTAPPAAAPPAPSPAPPGLAYPPQADAQVTRPDADSPLDQAPAVAGAEARQAPGSSAPGSSAPENPEAFATGPGVAATSSAGLDSDWATGLARALDQQWRPPADLSDPLRYSLTLAPDGTVVALVPLNEISATYQATPTLPLPGTIIPGVAGESTVTVEVQFLPTGAVVVVPPGGSAP